MLCLYCPYCEEQREEEEFFYAGEAHRKRSENIDSLSDEAFGRYLYFRKNPRGLHKEMWLHAMGCRKYFNVLRDTQTYKIIKSYPMTNPLETTNTHQEKEVAA